MLAEKNTKPIAIKIMYSVDDRIVSHPIRIYGNVLNA